MSGRVRVFRAYADVAGLQLHYRWAGGRELPALLLLHQSPSTSAMYIPLMARLADRFHLVAPDTPGFGNSDSLPGEVAAVSIADYAGAMHALVETLGLAPCYLFGHHTGAAIAVQLAHDFPGTARAMALSGPPLLSEELQQALPARAAPIPLAADGSHLQAMWQRLREKDPDAAPELLQRELHSAFSCGAAYQASYRAVCRQDFAGQLPGIGCPVLVYAGDADPLYGAVAPTAGLLPRGVATTLPGGGRTYVCERQADIIAARLAEFFGNCGT